MAAYYNENDPKAAAWLRLLIAEGHIAGGIVDERSIAEVQPVDLRGFVQCHFFAGIGGWSYALRLAGWADDRPVWTGSCPCQPFSYAGKGLAEKDPRHLWPELRRLIGDPDGNAPDVFGEQVASKVGRLWLAGVRADLEALGRSFAAADLCAAGLTAPHIRQRLFWVAYAQCPTRGESSIRRDNDQSEESERNKGAGRVGECREARGMAYAEHAERRSEQQGSGAGSGRSGLGGSCRAFDRGNFEHGASTRSIGVADMQQPRLEKRHFSAARYQPSSIERDRTDCWDKYDLIPCADGKARRIESGTFPLVNGLSGRVGLLRGYGNAIVPQVAAEFIQAAEQARFDLISQP
jgi:DNA (cytosine-5)-methyltransferase 1